MTEYEGAGPRRCGPATSPETIGPAVDLEAPPTPVTAPKRADHATDYARSASEGKRPTSNVDAALDHARRGFHVFPIRPGAKSPPLVRWKTEATTDPNKIHRLWADWPTANIGIATGPSGLLVVDVDIRDGKPGEESLDNIQLEWGDLPQTLTAVTASGGRHLYFWGSAKSRNSEIGEALDVKSEGGYVVAPGSRLTDEGECRWENSTSPAEAPEWLIKVSQPARSDAYLGNAEAGLWTPEELAFYLSYFDPEDYGDDKRWRDLAMSAHHGTAGVGREEFLSWSADDAKYDDARHARNNRVRWNSFGPKPGVKPITYHYLLSEINSKLGYVPHVPPELDFEPVTEAELSAWFNVATTTVGGGEFR